MRRLTAAVATGTLLLVQLAGCGGNHAKPHAAPTTASTTLGPGEIAPKVFVADLLAAMKTKKSAHMVLSVGRGLNGSADVSYGATTDAEITARYGGGSLQVIRVGGDTYIQQNAGGKFTHITANDPAAGAIVKQFALLGPREALGAIAAGITKVRSTGTVANSGGVRTYRVTVDGKAASQALTFGSADVPKSIDLTFVTLDSGLLVDVDGDLGGQHLTLKISRWGLPVHVTAPAKKDLLNQ